MYTALDKKYNKDSYFFDNVFMVKTYGTKGLSFLFEIFICCNGNYMPDCSFWYARTTYAGKHDRLSAQNPFRGKAQSLISLFL